MGFRAEYGKLLEEIAEEADEIALKYFRALELEVERMTNNQNLQRDQSRSFPAQSN